jgi:hypothetical protein
MVLIIFSLIVYPFIGNLLGHLYPSRQHLACLVLPLFLLLAYYYLCHPGFPLLLLSIPAIWSIIGFSAAVSLGMKEDMGLLIAGFACTIMIIYKNKRTEES